MTDNQQYVHANGVNIYYEVYGAGAPLILIHGGLGSGRDWQAQLAMFTRSFQVFIPDSRGHGRSDNPLGSLSYRVMADDVAAFVGALGLQKPLIFGYSDGGQIALELAMRYPRLARAVVAAATGYAFSDTYRARVESLMGDAAEPTVDMHAVEAIVGDYMNDLRQTHTAVYGEAYLQDFLNQSKALWLTPLNYTAADFQQIVIPTLILVGDRDENIPVEEAVELYRMIPGAELCIAPHTTHGRTGESELVSHIARDFLTRHSPQT